MSWDMVFIPLHTFHGFLQSKRPVFIPKRVCPVVHRVVVIGYLVSSGEQTGLSLSVHRVFLKRAIFDLVMIPGMV